MAKKNWYKELLKISLCINIIMTLFPNFRSGSAIFYFNLQIGLAYYYLSLTKPSKSVTILFIEINVSFLTINKQKKQPSGMGRLLLWFLS